MRKFDTGATRDTDAGKPDYEGFLSPIVIARYGEYMNAHRVQSDGKLRDSDNWQKGIPQSAYMKSGWRHFFDWWKLHRRSHKGGLYNTVLEEALCALMFNVMGYLHEHLKLKQKAAADSGPAALYKKGAKRIRARIYEDGRWSDVK